MSAAVSALRGAPRRAGAVLGALAPTPRLRRRMVAALVIAALLTSLYLFVIRDLGVFGVNEVSVTGLTGKEAAAISAALQQAGRDSTTLHVNQDAIDAAVRRYPVIRSVSIQTDFPHGMRIAVAQEQPAAMLLAGGKRIPVAGDGSVLTGLPITTALPTVKVAGEVPEKQLTASGTFDAVRVLGGAPAVLTPRLATVTRQRGGKGWVVEVKDGPELIFGPSTQLAAKWAAATRILADPSSHGADYIDLRLPSRPAAGGLPVQTVEPVAPAGSQEDQGQGAATGQAQPEAQQQAPATGEQQAGATGEQAPATGQQQAPVTGEQAAPQAGQQQGVTP